MSNNLKIQVTADVVDLQTKFGIAKAETQALQTEFNGLAKTAAAGPLDAAAQAKYQQLAGDLLAARTQTAAYARELRDAGVAASGFGVAAVKAAEGAEGLGINTASAVRYTRELFDEISSGRTRYLPSTLASLAAQGFHLSPAMLAAAGGVAALAAGLAYLAYRAIEARDSLNQIDLNNLMSGNDVTRSQIDELTDQLSTLPNVSSSAAQGIVTALSQTHLPFDAMQAAARLAAERMVVMQETAEQAGKEVAKALSPETTATQVAKENQNSLTQAQVDAAEAADKAGNTNVILAQKLQLLSAPLAKARADVDEYHRSWGQALSDALNTIGAVESATAGGQQVAPQVLNPPADELREHADAWQKNATAIRQNITALAALPSEKSLTFKSGTSGESAALSAAQEAADIKHQMAEQEISDANRTLNAIAANEERAKDLTIAAAEQAAAVKKQMAEQEIQQANRMLNEMAAAQRKVDAQRLQSERQIVRGIESAEDTMISGILRGRQTFAQIAEQMAINLATKEIEVAAHSLTEQVALTQVAEAKKIAIKILSATKAIAIDAGEAAAGAFKAMVGIPYVGPILGAAAAAAALIEVKNFAHFDVGAWNIPQDMPAIVHRGETILPRPFAEDFRSAIGGGGGGGGDTYHVHTNVNAVDARGFSALLDNSAHRGSLVRMAKTYARRGGR